VAREDCIMRSCIICTLHQIPLLSSYNEVRLAGYVACSETFSPKHFVLSHPQYPLLPKSERSNIASPLYCTKGMQVNRKR
jgi:hypothetical protein